MIKEIIIEQVNVSDDEYTIVEINVNSAEKVAKGEMLLAYESSKSVFEYESQIDGYFYINPQVQIDEVYPVGFKIGIVSDVEIENNDINSYFATKDNKNNSSQPSSDINFTKKALKLFEESDIDIANFNGMKIVTEKNIIEFLKNKNSLDILDIKNFKDKNSAINNKGSKKLAVIGAGNAALQTIDATSSSDEYEIVNFYETNPEYPLDTLLGIEVKKIDSITKIIDDYNNGVFDEIIISFSGNIEARYDLFEELRDEKIPFANVIHKSALVSSSAEIGEGNLIFANVRVGPFCRLGSNNVISANCSIEHNNILGDGNTFGPYVAFSGSCVVGNKNRFGTMIGIEPLVTIGSNSIIASGLILTRNIDNNKLVKNLSKIEIVDLE